MKHKWIIFVFTTVVMLISGSSGATIITFDKLAGTNMPNCTSYSSDPLQTYFNARESTVDGIQFYATRHWYVDSDPDTSNTPYNGSDYLLTEFVTIRREDGMAFKLLRFDLASWGDYRNNTLRVVGTFADGSSIEQTINTDDLINSQDVDGNDFERFEFQGFENILLFTVQIIRGNNATFAIDNLDISDPDPVCLTPEDVEIELAAKIDAEGLVSQQEINRMIVEAVAEVEVLLAEKDVVIADFTAVSKDLSFAIETFENEVRNIPSHKYSDFSLHGTTPEEKATALIEALTSLNNVNLKHIAEQFKK